MKIAYVNVFVRDLARSMSFYEKQLGFQLEHGDPEHGYASFVVGPIRLGLAVAGDIQQDLVGRHTGVGFVVADLEAAYSRLSADGVEFHEPPTRQPWGGFMALLADPDGNVFYLDQPDAAHP